MSEKTELIDAMMRLETLVADMEMAEEKYQEFFEGNPIVFKVLGYTNHWSFTKDSGRSLPRDKYTGLKPEPDFIVQSESGSFEILELKTPTSKKLIVDSNEYRERFTAEVLDYVSQTTTYDNYFTRNPANGEAVKQLYGLNIQPDLDIKIVIGLGEHIDKAKIHQKAREYTRKIDIIPYDEIYGRLESRYELSYGHDENLPGISIHSIVRFHPSGTGERQYYLDFGSDPGKNRISLFLDEDNIIHFQVTDAGSQPYDISMPGNPSDALGQWIYLTAEFGLTGHGFLMSIGLNGDPRSKVTTEVDTSLNVDLGRGCLGCDMTLQQCGFFDLAIQGAFDNVISFRDRYLLRRHLLKNPAGARKYIHFSHGRHMNMVPGGDFVQDDPRRRPVMVDEDDPAASPRVELWKNMKITDQ